VVGNSVSDIGSVKLSSIVALYEMIEEKVANILMNVNYQSPTTTVTCSYKKIQNNQYEILQI